MILSLAQEWRYGIHHRRSGICTGKAVVNSNKESGNAHATRASYDVVRSLAKRPGPFVSAFQPLVHPSLFRGIIGRSYGSCFVGTWANALQLWLEVRSPVLGRKCSRLITCVQQDGDACHETAQQAYRGPRTSTYRTHGRAVDWMRPFCRDIIVGYRPMSFRTSLYTQFHRSTLCPSTSSEATPPMRMSSPR